MVTPNPHFWKATPVDVLSRAREIISEPEHWTQGASGRDAQGVPINVHDSRATCWCAMGAVAKAQTELKADASTGYTAYRYLDTETALWTFNDSRSHSEVLAMFDEAINANTLL